MSAPGPFNRTPGGRADCAAGTRRRDASCNQFELVRQAWALMIAGNITKILEFCGEKMFPFQDQMGSASTLPIASELWVVYSRALHLAGRLEEAKRVLNSGIQSGAGQGSPMLGP